MDRFRPHHRTCFNIYIIIYIIFLFFHPFFALFAAPQAVRQWIEKAEFYYRGGNLKAAHTQLEQARAVAPDDPDVARLARLIEAGKAKRVEAALRTARFYQSAGNVPEAEKAFREILGVDPGNPDARLALEALQKLKDTIEKYQESGVSVAPSTGRAFDVETYSVASVWLRARAAFSRGDLDTAEKFIDEILKREPAHSQALNIQATISQLRRINSLLSSLDKDLGTGDYFAAVTALDRLLQEYPGRPDLLLKRGRALLKLNRALEAIRDFEQLLATTTFHAQLLPDLSDAYAAAGKPLQAAAIGAAIFRGSPVKTLYQRLPLIWKSYPVSGSLFLLGCLLFLAALVWTWVQIEHLSERHALSHILTAARLAALAVLFGIADERVEEWKSLETQIRHPWFAYVYGLLLLRRGDFTAAQEPLQKALESPTLAPRAYYFLGILRGQLGQSVAGHDMEQSLLASFRGFGLSLIPAFLFRLEKELVERFATDEAIHRNGLESFSHQAALELFARRPGTGTAE